MVQRLPHWGDEHVWTLNSRLTYTIDLGPYTLFA
jgi:hypothetical protein